VAAREARADPPEDQARREAIRYTLSRWEGLARFLSDGRIEIDSNTVERSIRLIALNRKNALFAGSDGGAEHWAVIASLIETCKLNDVEPLGYLTDVLTRIVNDHLNSKIDDLLPWVSIAAPEFKAVA
jgi:transposase